jgi:hypothetical protein
MKKQIHPDGDRPFWVGATRSTYFDPALFEPVQNQFGTDRQWALHTDIGSLTVLDRMTGFGFRVTETGFRSPDGGWWLASGNHDVRFSGAKTLGQAIDWVKNNCQGQHVPARTGENSNAQI